MSDPVKDRRPYRSEKRARQREATRAAIVRAAAACFIRDGYPGTPITRIAQEAGVSPETVYGAFGSKRELLRAASVEGEEFSAEVAAHLAGMEEAEARRRLSNELDREHRLVQALGVQRVGDARLTRYRFHHFLIQRGLIRREGPTPPPMEHPDLGLCDAYWLREIPRSGTSIVTA